MGMPAPFVQPVYTKDNWTLSTEVPVSVNNPFPVQIPASTTDNNEIKVRVQNTIQYPVPTENCAIDTLLIGSVSAQSTPVRDLLGSTDAQAPTITQTAPYRRLILYLFVPTASTVTITLRGRATDASGVPLSNNWVQLYASGDISATTDSWHRVVMQATDGAPLGADQCRVEITCTVTQTIFFNLKGER